MAQTASFPTVVRDFDGDERISFSTLDNKYIAVHDDGTEFEFDAENRRWVSIDEDAPAAEAPAAEAPVSSHSQAAASKPSANSKKRKNGDGNQSKPRQNTAVYVTGLPTDATESEVHDLFSRKAGVIAEEIDSGKPRIKLYTDEQGTFKGDALIVFFKPQSVEMAIMLLDDTDFRFTATGTREGRIRVQAADSSYKKVKYDQDGAAAEGNGDAGGHQQGEQRRPQKSEKDRQKIIKRTQKLDAKLADWDDDDPYMARAPPPTKHDKTVVLRHMFTLKELEDDPAALLDIKEDVRDECAKLGVVTNVVLYDQEADGIVSVKFRDAESAAACIDLMHGRSFDGRTVEATLASGKLKFKKSQEERADSDSE